MREEKRERQPGQATGNKITCIALRSDKTSGMNFTENETQT